jgi:16S rRNA (guanine966-N2)-methyltransferase
VTRIVAGAARGRRLVTPAGRGTRPTSDRAREGLFSTIEALLGPLAGRRVLDLYAGSGAVGLEALSRGAAQACLVESDERTARVIRENVTMLGLPGADVVARRVEQALVPGPAGPPYDVVFADPPYVMTDDALRDVLGRLRDGGWLAPRALVVVERPTRGGEFEWPEGFDADRSRRYGEGTLWYGRAAK